MQTPRYYSASDYYKKLFGCKVYKLSLDAGCTCPTRDGTLGTTGCIFCSAGGSGEFAAPRNIPIPQQIEYARQLVQKKAHGRSGATQPSGTRNGETAPAAPKYIAYFQNFTNTYGDHDALEAKWRTALRTPDIAGIAIATRPDCLDSDMEHRIATLSRETFVQLELGLQTANDKTAAYIRRAYQTAVYDDAARRLKALTAPPQTPENRPADGTFGHTGTTSAKTAATVTGLHLVTQLIFGLPGETEHDMLDSVQHALTAGTDGIKITSLYVLSGTMLAQDYAAGKFTCLSQEAYFSLIAHAVELIPGTVVIHRLTGDGPKKLLVAPRWTADKRQVLNSLANYFTKNNIIQGIRSNTTK